MVSMVRGFLASRQRRRASSLCLQPDRCRVRARGPASAAGLRLGPPAGCPSLLRFDEGRNGAAQQTLVQTGSRSGARRRLRQSSITDCHIDASCYSVTDRWGDALVANRLIGRSSPRRPPPGLPSPLAMASMRKDVVVSRRVGIGCLQAVLQTVLRAGQDTAARATSTGLTGPSVRAPCGPVSSWAAGDRNDAGFPLSPRAGRGLCLPEETQQEEAKPKRG